MKVRGSSWKFALILLTGIIITAQLLFLIHWRWRFWHHQRWVNRKEELAPLPPTGWMVIEAPSSSEQQQIYIPTNEERTKEMQEEQEEGVQEKEQQQQRPSIVPKPTVTNKEGYAASTGGLSPIAQEVLCPDEQQLGGPCYVVVDGPDLAGRGFSRFLRLEPGSADSLMEVALDFPADYKFTKENSSQWPVLTNQLQLDYQRLAVSQPFITQTFSFNTNLSSMPEPVARRILCLGLQGSAVNNYFAHLSNKYDVTVVEPEQSLRYLAEKWFGFKESENHRIFVEKPAFYVTARARMIEKPSPNEKIPTRLDFILVDLCTGLGSAETPGNCPTAEFEDEKNVLALSKNLASNGTIVVHFFSPGNKSSDNKQEQQHQRQQLANHEHQILHLFQRHFKHCFFVSIASHLLLTCIPSAPLTRAQYLMAFRALPKEMQIFDSNQEPKFFLDIEALKKR